MTSLRCSILLLASLAGWACGRTTPAPTTPAGTTTLLVIEDDAPTNASACEERLTFARTTMDDVVARANGACTQDGDCELVFIDTQCQGACQAPILRANVPAFEQAKDAINERACTNYMEDGCSYSTPRCLQMQAVCRAERCEMAPLAEAG